MADDRRSADDRKFKDDLDELLSRANPNPSRIGCLTRDSLLALAARAQPLGDPGYEHLLKCSECYREFRRFQPVRGDQES
jgi:hypothetical protein